MDDEQALVMQMDQDPQDLDLLLVLADWYEEHGEVVKALGIRERRDILLQYRQFGSFAQQCELVRLAGEWSHGVFEVSLSETEKKLFFSVQGQLQVAPIGQEVELGEEGLWVVLQLPFLPDDPLCMHWRVGQEVSVGVWNGKDTVWRTVLRSAWVGDAWLPHLPTLLQEGENAVRVRSTVVKEQPLTTRIQVQRPHGWWFIEETPLP